MMLRRCRGQKIIVADSSKIGTEHNFFSGTLADVTDLITDSEASEQQLEQLRQAGLHIEVVAPLVEE